MPPSAFARALVPVLLLLTTASCMTTTAPPPTERPVVISERALVLDDATRAAMTSFEPLAGEVTFDEVPGPVAGLAPGDLLVSAPSAAAPYGLLRRVDEVRRDGDRLVLETSQAALTDALLSGEFDVSGLLEPEQLVEAIVHRPGVRTRALAPARHLDAIDGAVVSEGYRFEVTVDEVLDVGDDRVSGQVRVQGTIRFNASFDVGVGVELCWTVACVDRFEVRLGIDHYTDLVVTGTASGHVEEEHELATFHFKPIVVMIGPFPLVLVPVIDVSVGASGEARLDVRFGARESLRWLVGAKWTDPDDDGAGWQDLGQRNGFAFELDTPQVEAAMRLRSYGEVHGQLLFYGAAGFAADAKLGAGLDVAVPRRPLWRLFGYLGGGLSFDVDFGGILRLAEFNIAAFHHEFDLADAPNLPPRFSGVVGDLIRVPVEQRTVLGPRAGFSGFFDVADPEGGTLTLRAVSDRDGPIALNPIFRTVGRRTVTITATDDEGASASTTLRIEVTSSAPILLVTVPGDTVAATVQFRIDVFATDFESGDLPCDRLTWDVQEPDTVRPQTRGSGSCGATAVFRAPGVRTVRIGASDPHGSTSSETVTVIVTDPPVNGPPVFDLDSLRILAFRGPRSDRCITGFWCDITDAGSGTLLWNGLEGDYRPPLEMTVRASDPENDPLIYRWSCRAGSTGFPVVDNGDGSFSCDVEAFPIDSLVEVRVEVSDGHTTITDFRLYKTLNSPR